MRVLLGVVALTALLAAAAAASGQKVALTLSYCPNQFSGKGSVVTLDPHDQGNFSVVAKDWEWPDSSSWGCPENQDPTVLVDGSDVWLQFGTDWGYTTEVSTKTGKVARSYKVKTKQMEFDGFTAFVSKDLDFLGVTPGVTESGFCDDGCFQFGRQNKLAGEFTGLGFVPYKAAMTNVGWLDEHSGLFYSQMSYPLLPEAYCSKNETDQCMVAIDSKTGKLASTKAMNSVEVYSWAPHTMDKDGSMLAWVFGFEGKCEHPYNDYAFARVNPAKATAEFISCISKNVTVHEDPNIAAFSDDGSLFATGSGNAETGDVQLLVFETKTGNAVLQSDLPGLKGALGVSSTAPFINVWGVSWA